MSKLYASITSDARRTPATSRGHRNLSAHLRGKEVGMELDVIATDDGEIRFMLMLTRGSNGGVRHREHILTIHATEATGDLVSVDRAGILA